jgi:predicted nuclease of predicted toxin-antitoxin system
MPLRFHLDESVHRGVAYALRRRGIDVTTPKEAELLSAGDAEHLAFATAQGRVIITHDSDFLRLSASGVPHNGIVFCHNQTVSVGEMVRALERLSLICDTMTLRDQVKFL